MKKILVGLSLLGLSASANAFDFFDNNNGEWKMGPYGPYYEESDWPEWTPMYWMEEMMDSFDDEDGDYLGNMPFNNNNNFKMPFSNGSSFRMPFNSNNNGFRMPFNSGNGFRMPFSTNSYVPYGYGAAPMMAAPAPMPYGYGAAPMMRPAAPAMPMAVPQPAPQAPAAQATTKPGPAANTAQ